MRVLSCSLAIGLLSGFAAAAQAQFPTERTVDTSVDRAFEPAPKDCTDVRWSATVLNQYPSIATGCQAVEQRNGKTYVKLQGTVEEVKGGGKRVRVDLKDGDVVTFTPTPRTGLYIDGERTEFGKLNEGIRLNFYIPEDRLQAELQPDPERLAYIIVPFDVDVAAIPEQSRTAGAGQTDRERARDSMTAAAQGDQGEMDTLPRTAGPLPFLALGGFALLALGGGLTLRRKRLNRWNAWF